ncbi:hypothetical protein U27_02823 [Candidatus Vecturithrix granuli]|uniref:Uncharacterized protein n=1 Tax=Vecturithrix granuli TaxID=1499967 RepID=A0A081BU57_VECG1|nr:hypothetical protein U27_02823 [Candidatus Vecturithrix granuli]
MRFGKHITMPENSIFRGVVMRFGKRTITHENFIFTGGIHEFDEQHEGFS